MKEETEIKDVLKWLGIAVLAAIPVILLLKKLNPPQTGETVETADIFAEELS
ncbi:MAG TPA: hypothetical protein VKS81_03155 [Bacteroidota bacterium]|nr:hypothetical protein [Bacteroidota bacterium]